MWWTDYIHNIILCVLLLISIHYNSKYRFFFSFNYLAFATDLSHMLIVLCWYSDDVHVQFNDDCDYFKFYIDFQLILVWNFLLQYYYFSCVSTITIVIVRNGINTLHTQKKESCNFNRIVRKQACAAELLHWLHSGFHIEKFCLLLFKFKFKNLEIASIAISFSFLLLHKQ